MKDITINSKEGPSFELIIPAPAAIDSFFIFSLHKAGSTLLNNILEKCCIYNEIPYVNFPGECFKRGIPFLEVDQDTIDYFESRGYCYGGFRLLTPLFKDFDFVPYKKIYLIRDPRDIVVSFYYSMLKSHPIPKEGALSEKIKESRERLMNVDINDYVLKLAPVILERIEGMQQVSQERMKLYRYEDIIFKKKEWIKDMMAFLDLDLKEVQIDKIISKHDIIPAKEDQSKHIRKVTPGDHKEKLNKNTIEELNRIFHKPLVKYGYL